MITNADGLLEVAQRRFPAWTHEIQRESRMRPREDGEDHLFVVSHIPDASRACGLRGIFVPVTVPIDEETVVARMDDFERKGRA